MVRAVLGGVAVIGVAAGCSVYVDGEPAAEGQSATTTEETVEYNPCTDLSDEALQATGLDPATKGTVTDAPTGPVTWRMCQWTSTEGPYLVTVGASVYTQDDVRQNSVVTGFRDAQIGPRSGLTFYDKNDEDQLRCYVSLPSEQGVINVIVNWYYSQKESIPQSPPCDLAIQHAAELEPYLPK
uniref:DUF3558 domain-containing protein n=1 Tax=Nocardia donostiensis TaxID=1538463 RepID=UPI001FEC3035|nr:DUF3558 domain-containing protein [Nocardia donostiensis]